MNELRLRLKRKLFRAPEFNEGTVPSFNEFADLSGIAPPGQEGCREATGWWIKEIFW